MVWDLSLPVFSGMPVYPGDPPVRIEPRALIAQGEVCNLHTLILGTHSGTHLDAPRHFLDEGIPIDEVHWSALLGPARLVQVPPGGAIDAGFLAALDLAGVQRLLLRTRGPGEPPPTDYSRGWRALTPEAAQLLVEAGLLLLGVDTPAVDALHGSGHPVHHVLLGAGMVLVENLDLREPPEGDYGLICLPLRLQGMDGSPCRAILLRE